MSEEHNLLPPASEAQPSEAPKSEAFNLAAHAAKLKATPKEQYEQPKKEQAPPQPEPEPTKAGGPGTGESSGSGAKADHEASAKEFIELYDIAQSYGFHFYSGKAVESFQLPAFAKDRAAHHLAKGLEKMGGMEAPWWMGLLLAIGPPTAFNFMAAKQYREQRRQGQEREEAAQRRGSGPVQPDSIIHHGQVIKMRPERPAQPPPPIRPAKDYGRCQTCGNPVKHKGRKYCSQSCAAKGTNAKRRKAKPDAPTQPAASNDHP